MSRASILLSRASILLLLPCVAAFSVQRAALLETIAPLNRGFSMSKEQKKAVTAAIDALAAAAPQADVPDLTGDWELIYTDAPDILGLDAQAGPFATCTRIGQQIDEAAGTISNVIEYGPREWASSLVGQAKGDLLQQRVVTSFNKSGTKVDLKIKGLKVVPKQFFGVSLESVPPLKLEGFVEPPFGSFEVLYCEPALALADGEEVQADSSPIRVIKTINGYYSVNRRVGSIGECWGDA